MKSAVLLVVLLIVTCLSVSSQQDVQYFPAGTFSDSPTLDIGTVRWYSKQLNALAEPSLWTASKDFGRERYRFLWLRTWDHPVSIRIEKNEDGTASLTLKVATGSGGYEPGKLDVTRTKQLSKGEFEAVSARFRTSGFWTMATTEHSNGHDGAQWVVEAANNGQYHLVDRWSPKEGALKDLALHLLQLSDYGIPRDKVY